ncbi:MAG TPA: ATP-dependent DNA helicase, partial [Gammaproteobacteria bacterium]|nr:ATP-dependent DNA helicase [Gammaproteobacteria bacterium]
AIILDEAHQIPDLAAQFFGVSVGSRELERLFDEIRAATVAVGQAELRRRIDKAQTALKKLRAAAPRDEGRYELSVLMPEIHASLDELMSRLRKLMQGVGEFTDASIEIDKLHEQVIAVIERLAQISSDDGWDGLRWLDVNPRSIRLHLTPLDVSETLHGMIDNGHQAWIFTSATLAVGEDFSHFGERMGLNSATGITFPSPYALDKHGLIWLPPGLPPPSDPDHTSAMLEQVTPLLGMTSGGMFCLFTSHRALKAAREWFRAHRKILQGRPLLVQGDAPRDDLLRRFRERGNAVLLGTGSFWEGVDVRGSALTIVAIDKLPFASPADPLMMARLEYIRRRGGNGFTEHQLPQAALALKQGAGRLLRDQNDFGVVVICDPRITGKNYGSVFLKCLEPMPCTESRSEVEQFLQAHESQANYSAKGRQTG